MNKREIKARLDTIVYLAKIFNARQITYPIPISKAYIALSTVLDHERVHRELMQYLRG